MEDLEAERSRLRHDADGIADQLDEEKVRSHQVEQKLYEVTQKLRSAEMHSATTAEHRKMESNGLQELLKTKVEL